MHQIKKAQNYLSLNLEKGFMKNLQARTCLTFPFISKLIILEYNYCHLRERDLQKKIHDFVFWPPWLII